MSGGEASGGITRRGALAGFGAAAGAVALWRAQPVGRTVGARKGMRGMRRGGTPRR